MTFGRIGKKLLASAALAVGLAGCEWPTSNLSFMPSIASFSNLPSFGLLGDVIPDFNGDCATVSPKALKRVNWTRVPQINMRVRNDEFEPMIIQMTQGWPYVFRIRNRDDRSHTINAKKFFQNMAVIRITVAGERQGETCIASLDIPPRATAEIHLVAAVDGHYEFHDNWLPAPTAWSLSKSATRRGPNSAAGCGPGSGSIPLGDG